MPNLSFNTLATGATAFVVQEAREIILCLLWSYLSSFTPKTKVMSALLAGLIGAETNTFLAPACRCFEAVSLFLNLPVDSIAR